MGCRAYIKLHRVEHFPFIVLRNNDELEQLLLIQVTMVGIVYLN